MHIYCACICKRTALSSALNTKKILLEEVFIKLVACFI